MSFGLSTGQTDDLRIPITSNGISKWELRAFMEDCNVEAI